MKQKNYNVMVRLQRDSETVWVPVANIDDIESAQIEELLPVVNRLPDGVAFNGLQITWEEDDES